MRRPSLRPPGRPKPSDVTSGPVTGLFSIPEGTAYASIAGFDPVAGLFSGVWLALIVLAPAPLPERIPMPVIGGLITVVGGELIVGRVADIELVLRTPKLSSAARPVAFLGTAQLPLQQAVILGAVLPLLLYCVRASRQAELTALTRTADGHRELADTPAELPAGRVTVLAYSGVSLFAELPLIDADWPRAPDGPAVLVLVVRTVPDVPSSSTVKLLRRRNDELGARGGRLIVAGAQPSFVRPAEHTGLAGAPGPDGVVPADPVLDASLEEAVARGEHRLAAERTAAD